MICSVLGCLKTTGKCVTYTGNFISGPDINNGDNYETVIIKLKAYIDEAGGGGLTLTANSPLSYDSGTGTLSLPKATSLVNGYLSFTDWNTFNSKVSPSRTISTTSPLSGGGDLSTNRTLTIQVANTSQDGYLTSTDWDTFNDKLTDLANTVTTGAEIWKDTTGAVANLRRIQGGVNVTVTELSDSILIDASGGGGGSDSLTGNLFS